MVAEDIIAALQLPEQARVNQRVSKKLLIENLAPTAADRQQINEGIEEIQWVAALKPGNCGIPAYRDTQREYVEVAVLHLTLRPSARPARLIELLHRAVPHPTLLMVSTPDSVQLSLSHKRWAQKKPARPCSMVKSPPLRCCQPPLRSPQPFSMRSVWSVNHVVT